MQTPDGKEIIPGCEPWSAEGGPHGVLVLHGFTGNPQSMRGLAEAFAAAGFTVELPLLPGHGTSVDDMVATAGPTGRPRPRPPTTTWRRASTRWSSPACRWAGRSPPGWPPATPRSRASCASTPPSTCRPRWSTALREMVDGGIDRIPAIGGDVADPGRREKAYDATPLEPLLSLAAAADESATTWPRSPARLLLMTSPQDHVVDPG